MWKVLLVDDEEGIRRLLKSVLEMGDFSVDTASCARSAIDVLRTQSFDVVLTDLRMETHLAGYDVARFASHLSPRPLVVIVTAFPVPASQWRTVGADALFTKGTDTLQLANRLHHLLKEKKAAMAKSRGESGIPSATRRSVS